MEPITLTDHGPEITKWSHLVDGISDGAWGFQLAARGPGKTVWAALHLEAGTPTTGHVAGQIGTGQPSNRGRGART